MRMAEVASAITDMYGIEYLFWPIDIRCYVLNWHSHNVVHVHAFSCKKQTTQTSTPHQQYISCPQLST